MSFESNDPRRPQPSIAMLQAQQEQEKPKAIAPMMPREALLREALKITSHDRNSAYGNPEDNFRNIADRWNLYLRQRFAKLNIHAGVPMLEPIDVAYMMIDMKMARLAPNPTHKDSLVDVAGYAACAADCQAGMVNYASAIAGAAQSSQSLVR